MCGARVLAHGKKSVLRDIISMLYAINSKKLRNSELVCLCLQKEIKYNISTTMGDTVVVSATSLGVGIWQDDDTNTNLSSKDTGGVVDIIIRSSSSSFSHVDPASKKITSTLSKTFDSSTSSLTTDAAANSSNNSAPSNFKQKKRVRPISPENTI